MAASFSYWKGFIDKTLKDRKRRLPVNDMDNMVKGKGIIRTLIDDHRDASMLRHALCDIYLKLSGKTSGRTPHYDEESGLVQAIFREIYRLRGRIEELEALINQHHSTVYPHVPNCDHASVSAVADKNARCYG